MKLFIPAIAIPAALVGYTLFHPGVAYSQTSMSKLAATSIQQSGSYTIDPNHTSISFEVRHLGIARVHGDFNTKKGAIQFNKDDLTHSSMHLTIDTTSIDTGVAPRDTHLKSADFLDVEKFPSMKFVSTSLRKEGEDYVLDGELTLKDVTKKVSIPFALYGPITDPWGNQRIGVIAQPIKINRQDFNVAYDQKLPDGTPSVDNELTIRLSLEATRDKS